MRVRAFAVMASWLFLFGCDDEPKNKSRNQFSGGHYPASVKWDKKGCSSDEGDFEVEGEKGRLKIDWDYIPGAVALFASLAFVYGVARRGQV